MRCSTIICPPGVGNGHFNRRYRQAVLRPDCGYTSGYWQFRLKSVRNPKHRFLQSGAFLAGEIPFRDAFLINSSVCDRSSHASDLREGCGKAAEERRDLRLRPEAPDDPETCPKHENILAARNRMNYQVVNGLIDIRLIYSTLR
ncbi:hypothetical protein Bbelb_230000 [Branchiostoma belcheri]|nr:hypothetical protein Bbelb_230000 [Branchiostoma belcheri]